MSLQRTLSFLLIIVIVLDILSEKKCLAADYCKVKCKEGTQHTVCSTPCSASNCEFMEAPQDVKDSILDRHNELRDEFAKSKKAADMMVLSWDNDVAFVAECWAKQCIFGHDKCRNTEKFPWDPYKGMIGVGQNIYMDTGKSSLKDISKSAADAWYGELPDVPPEIYGKFDGKAGGGKMIGHATQLLWAKTNSLGCGWSHSGAKKENYLVCNYGPAGNLQGAPIFTAGEPASKCPDGLKPNSKFSGLCGEISYATTANVPKIQPLSVLFVFGLGLLLYVIF